MTFKHKLSRRLAALCIPALALVAAGCADAPTKAPVAEEAPSRPAGLDPALAVSSASAVGQRVRTDRYVHVYSQASRRSSTLGVQRDGVLGTVLQGPSPITANDPYPLFRVNFDSGVDGWVLGAYISLVSPLPPPPPPPPAPVATVTVAPSSLELVIGSTGTVAATLRDSAGNTLTGRTVSWTSSNAGIATVSAAGTITAVAAGSASVTATSEGRSASVAVTVPAPVVPIAMLAVWPNTSTLTVGATLQMMTQMRDASGTIITGRDVTWSSSNPAVAAVNATGLITAIGAGSATVTAAREGLTASVAITVTAPVVNVASVAVTPATVSLATLATAQLATTVRDSAGNILAGRTITWTSSNAAIASVSSTGIVLGVAAGSATITASTGGRSGTATVTITAPTTPPPPPPPSGTAIFRSSWGTATGRTASAFLDGSSTTPWGFYCCDAATNSSVVSAASLGLQKWPTTNVYRVGTLASMPTGIPNHQVVADIGVPAAGSHRYFRYYLQVVYNDTHGAASEGNIEHGVETAPAITGSGRGMNFYRIPNNDGTWWPAYRDIATGVRYIASGLRLYKNRTYRMEWHIAYGSTTYQMQVRIYDEDGVLVATEGDFFQLVPSRNTSLRLGAHQFPYSAGDHRYFRVGTNGPSSNFPMQNMRDENLFLHGAVAVCTTGWCGPVAP